MFKKLRKKKFKKQYLKNYKTARFAFWYPNFVWFFYYKIYSPLYTNFFCRWLLLAPIVKIIRNFFLVLSFLYFIVDFLGYMEYTPFVFLPDFWKDCMLSEIRFFIVFVCFFYFIYSFTYGFLFYGELFQNEKIYHYAFYIRWTISKLWEIRTIWILLTTGIFGLYFKIPFLIICWKTIPFWVEWVIDWLFTYFFN